jgi:hypothetical protein
LQPEDLPPYVFEPAEANEPQTLDEAVFRAKREFVERVMKRRKLNFKKAADIIGQHPAGLARLLDSLDLSHLKKPARRRFEAR